MSEVKRYEMKTTYRGHESWDSLEEDKDGSYVSYEEYAELEAKFAALAAENAKDLGGIKNYKRGEKAVAEFESLITPHIVLALLDEIKHMQDQAIDDGCRIAELEEALQDKQALIPDEFDTTNQQYESLAKSE